MNHCARRSGDVPRIRPRKSLGQNFLQDLSCVTTIIDCAELDTEDAVVEIGAGTGFLTQALSGRAAHVVAVEVDARLVDVLREKLGDATNVDIVHGDILRLSLTELLRFDTLRRRRCKVVGNLPYYITTPVIIKLLEEGGFLERIVVMVQKEVAERIVAAPGSKRYGAFSVMAQYHTVPEIVARVPREAFWPEPEVDSAVVRMVVRGSPPVEVADEGLYFDVVRAAFRSRRKTLVRALTLATRARGELAGVVEGEGGIRRALDRAGIDPRRRAETLTLEEFARLARAIEQVIQADAQG